MPWICGSPECKKQPYYAEPGTKRPKFCFLHKLPGHIDVRNKRCEAAAPVCFFLVSSLGPQLDAAAAATHRLQLTKNSNNPASACT